MNIYLITGGCSSDDKALALHDARDMAKIIIFQNHPVQVTIGHTDMDQLLSVHLNAQKKIYMWAVPPPEG